MAKYKVVWSQEAEQDLFSILGFFFERNGTVDYSRRLNNNIRKKIELLRFYPNLGTKTNLTNVRTLIFEEYQILHEIADKEIRIIMVWDSRQNPNRKVSDLGNRIKE